MIQQEGAHEDPPEHEALILARFIDDQPWLAASHAVVKMPRPDPQQVVAQAQGVLGRVVSALAQDPGTDALFRADGSATTDMSQVVEFVALTHRRQQQINEDTARLVAANYRANLHNMCRNRTLAALVDAGKAEIHRLDAALGELNCEVAVQREQASQLRHALETTRRALQRTVGECRRALAAQQAVLSEQQRAVAQIQSARARQAVALDGAVALGALVATRSALIDVPVRAVARLLVSRLVSAGGSSSSVRRHRAFARALFKLAIAVALTARTRSLLASWGLCGEFVGYKALFQTAFSQVWSSLSNLPATPRENLTSEDAPPKPQ